MRALLRKLARPALAVLGLAVILAAIALGAFRLALAQLPGYQAEMQAWASDALGIALDFERLDARWGLAGPELTLHEARVATPGRAAPFLDARRASLVLRPWSLLARRELAIRRLAFEGTRLTIFRTEDGRFRLQEPLPGAPTQELAFDVPPEVELVVRDSEVVYVDRARDLEWRFSGVTVSLEREAGRLSAELRARPPEEFASRIELTAEGAFDGGARLGGDWRVSADARGVDFAVLARSLPSDLALPRAGRGDVSLWANAQDGSVVRGTVAMTLANVVLPESGAADPRYDRVAFRGEWLRLADGWRAVLNDVQVTRGGRSWPGLPDLSLEIARGPDGRRALSFTGGFLRLEDLAPLAAFAPTELAERWLALAPEGDVRNARLVLREPDAAAELPADYEVEAELADFGIAEPNGRGAVRGLSASVRADSRSGRVDLASRGASIALPELFRAPLPFEQLAGIVVWRQGQDALRVVSDDLLVVTPDATLRSDLELTVPSDGSSPRLDLKSAISAFDVPDVKRYLPVGKLPPGVLAWLDRALAGGRVRRADVTLFGDLASFPFDDGRGEFAAVAEVENAVLDYVDGWPVAEELTGTVEFRNAGFSGRGRGRVLGNRSEDADVRIEDLRSPVLTVHGTTTGALDQVLEFLRRAPPIERHLGAEFARLAALGGTGDVRLDLALPLRDLAAFELEARLAMRDGELAVVGLTPGVSGVNGELVFADGSLRGEGITGVFLDGPLVASVGPSSAPGYRARLDLEGEVTAAAVAGAFRLPFAELAAGQTRWQGSLLLPDPAAREPLPARIGVRSNLTGVALRFPAPFAKSPGEAMAVQFDLALGGDALEAHGSIGASRRFALELERDGEAYRFRRGALNFGGAVPELATERGLTIQGTLPELHLEEWLALRDAAPGRPGGAAAEPLLASADLDIGDFSAFGQGLGASRIAVRRRTTDWQVDVDSAPVAGTILLPHDLGEQPRIIAVMKRLFLTSGRASSGAGGALDPRKLPGLQLHSDEFALGPRRLGRLDAEVLADPLGLRLVSFESSSASYRAEGSGGWFVDERGETTTRLALTLTSTDVAAMLTELGFDPMIEAERASISASVHWPGPPAAGWMNHLAGDVGFEVDTGSLLDVDPGAGRVVGLFSLGLLPRRLALDFRDVFNRGLVFDRITADFAIIDGNAYTDNLKLTGPVAEIGVVGRTGLRDRDYRQQAVVTAEPGKVLPTVGGLIGGPGVAAALLIFTRIFKEPLKGIGRASYCVTGSWQTPTVQRLTAEQLERGEICAELPPDARAAQVR